MRSRFPALPYMDRFRAFSLLFIPLEKPLEWDPLSRVTFDPGYFFKIDPYKVLA